MKTSELIKQLAQTLANHGDLPVHIYNDEWDTTRPVRSVSFEKAKENKKRKIPDTPDCVALN